MKKITKANLTFGALVLALSGAALIPAVGDPHPHAPDKTKKKSKVVYVCACLKIESCPCMTEAKMEGPCACGTQGGPPLKEVLADSDWAKQNRDALAQTQ